jgi:hypothetical protein
MRPVTARFTTKKSTPKKMPQARVSCGWTLAPPSRAAAMPIARAVKPSALEGRRRRLRRERA